MGFFPGESLVRPPGWLRKAEGGATLIPCPSGFGRLDIFSRFTTGTKRLYVERWCRLGGREVGSGPQILAQDHLLSQNLGGLLQGCRTRDKGIPYSLEQAEGSCRESWLPPTMSSAHRPMAASICVNPSLGCVVRACFRESPAFPYQRLSFWVFSGGWWPRLRDPWPFSLEEVLVEPGPLQAGPCPFTTWHF